MGYNLRGSNPNQILLLPPDLNDWLPQEHLARFIPGVADARSCSEDILEYMARLGGPYSYIKGVAGDAINLFMTAAAFNCGKWMHKLAQLFALILGWLFGETRDGLAT